MADSKKAPEAAKTQPKAPANTLDEMTPEEMRAKLEIQEEVLAEMKAQQGSLEATVAKLAPKAAANTKAPLVEVDKKSYRVVSNAIVPGKGKFTAEEIAEDAELCVHLVSIKSGVLQAIGE